MICDCGQELSHGAQVTELGNEIDYSECPNCGVVEVKGMTVEKEDIFN